jgi:hypothetical protein
MVHAQSDEGRPVLAGRRNRPCRAATVPVQAHRNPQIPQMTGHVAEFGRKKPEAIVALLTHRTIEEAASAVNIST